MVVLSQGSDIDQRNVKPLDVSCWSCARDPGAGSPQTFYMALHMGGTSSVFWCRPVSNWALGLARPLSHRHFLDLTVAWCCRRLWDGKLSDPASRTYCKTSLGQKTTGRKVSLYSRSQIWFDGRELVLWQLLCEILIWPFLSCSSFGPYKVFRLGIFQISRSIPGLMVDFILRCRKLKRNIVTIFLSVIPPLGTTLFSMIQIRLSILSTYNHAVLGYGLLAFWPGVLALQHPTPYRGKIKGVSD